MGQSWKASRFLFRPDLLGSLIDKDRKILLMEDILHQLRLVVYPIIYVALYISGGAGFLPSTVRKVKIIKKIESISLQ